MFAGTVYEADDEEADKIWESVDNRMDARRRARRWVQASSLLSTQLVKDTANRFSEAAEAEAAAKERALNPKLQTQFADLKRSLSTLNDADWNSIPEAGNMTGKRRKHNLRMEENQNGRSYAVSDTVLAGAAAKNQLVGELDLAQQENGGLATPATDGTMTDLSLIHI